MPSPGGVLRSGTDSAAPALGRQERCGRLPFRGASGETGQTARCNLDGCRNQGQPMANHHAHQLRRGLFTAVSALALVLVASATALGAVHSNGNTSQPQPLSNADKNSGGANGQCPGGPYCSTRDG